MNNLLFHSFAKDCLYGPAYCANTPGQHDCYCWRKYKALSIVEMTGKPVEFQSDTFTMEDVKKIYKERK
jgi:hypothetical protein